MTEHNEHEPTAPEPGETPPPEPPAAQHHPTPPPAGPGDRSAAHAYEGAPPPPRPETLAYGAPAGPGRWSGRARRWSANGTARMGVVTLVAGLVGGLVGGGIVAAFSDHGNDHMVRVVQPGMRGYGMPGFRGPRYWGPPNGRTLPNGPGVVPGLPQTPAPPTPSPRSSG